MNKKEYSEALKSPKWLSKRRRIKNRDGHKCVKCNCKENLHVHHTYYLRGKMPWEVPDECLITLCEICHEKEHRGRDISTFVRDAAPKQTKTPTIKKKAVPKKPRKERREANKKLKEKKKLQDNLSKADKELQNKYDVLKKKGKLPESTYKPLENPDRKIPKRKRKKRKK